MLSPRLLLVVLVLTARVVAAEPTAPSEPASLAGRDLAAGLREKLGDKAGLPEVADKFIPIPKEARWLTPAEAKGAFAKMLPRLEKLRWWKIGLDPTTLTHPLREPAAVVSGCVHAIRAGLDGSERALALAREAADFLLWAQEQGGADVFPFPAVRGAGSDQAAFAAVDHFLSRAERAGRLSEAVHRGWIIDDLGDGGLQFDNAEAGQALLELYALTHEPKYLAAARRAANWAKAHAPARNWNYNAFSVSLLAQIYRATGEAGDRHLAALKAGVGVIPGQLTEGPRAGRWVDAHNARPAYHYIMIHALAQLAAIEPKDFLGRADLMRALRLGLLARNVDFIGPGAPNKDKAAEALIFVNRSFADDPAFLHETKSAEALDALGRLISDEYRRGAAPLGPREWGLFLEYIVERAAPKTPDR